MGVALVDGSHLIENLVGERIEVDFVPNTVSVSIVVVSNEYSLSSFVLAM